MPSMKINQYVIFTVVTITLLISACQKDTTDDPRDNLVGTWKCQETGTSSGTQTFQASISKSSSDSTQLFIDNFYGTQQKIKVTMSSFSLIISKQTVDNYSIQGTGVVSSDFKKITWSYTADDGGEVDNVSSTYTPYQAKNVNLDSLLKAGK